MRFLLSRAVTCVASVLFLVLCLPVSANERIGDFSLLDTNGRFHQLSYYGDQKAVVLYLHRAQDEAVAADVALLDALSDKYAVQDVVFYLLNAAGDDRAHLETDLQALGTSIPLLVDESQLVAESIGATQIGQAYLLDARAMRPVYVGAAQGLDSALQSFMTGAAISAPTPVEGGQISFKQRDAHAQNGVSYTNDIVPILRDNCVSCHHDGGIGSWAMSDHNMVRGWSAMMREVVMTRRMPPGQIDTHVGKSIKDVAGLSIAEQQKLVHWIDAGAPLDGEADPLAALTFDNPKFTLGEPDLVFKVAAQEIPATGVIDYRYIPVPLNLDKDVWVRAMEFVPGDEEVLHHVIAYVSSPADKTVRGRQTGAARGESVGGFAPGRGPEEFRDNSGRLLPKGSSLLLQMHYTTSGRVTVDETEIGIYLYDEPPQYVMSGGVAGQRQFIIPPQVKEHPLQGEELIERDAYLYAMNPHMHFRGKYMNYTAEYPDGTSELLLSVPKYDFNWQFNYELAEPLFLPAGTKLVARGAMDNSDRNPGNPDPTKPVFFGLQTKHEMFFGFTTLRYVGDTPESIGKGEKTASAPAQDQTAPGVSAR